MGIPMARGARMPASPSDASPPSPSALWRGPSRLRRWQDRAAAFGLASCAAIGAAITIGIVLVIGWESWAFFRTSGVGAAEILTGTAIDFRSTPPRFGLVPLAWGTFLIASGSAVVAVPLGLLGAIGLSEYSPRGRRGWARAALGLLSGMPALVYGFLALELVTPALRGLGLPVAAHNALAACIVVGLMATPTVVALGEQALSAVPADLRAAAYGLGASRFAVVTKLVLPAAAPGLAAAVLLAISRAVGETLAVALAAGFHPRIGPDLFGPVRTLTTHILAVVSGNATQGTPEDLSLFLVGLVLFAIASALNLAAVRLMRGRWEARP